VEVSETGRTLETEKLRRRRRLRLLGGAGGPHFFAHARLEQPDDFAIGGVEQGLAAIEELRAGRKEVDRLLSALEMESGSGGAVGIRAAHSAVSHDPGLAHDLVGLLAGQDFPFGVGEANGGGGRLGWGVGGVLADGRGWWRGFLLGEALGASGDEHGFL
jgi:hypothetical protein